jgi:dipeptidyl aminopeptidase/acylaminoacyl peptidase
MKAFKLTDVISTFKHLLKEWFKFTTILSFFFIPHGIYAQADNEKLKEEILALANVGSCGAASFTASGKEIVFISNMSGSPQIWKIPATGGWPIQLTAFPDPVTAMSASPANDLIAFQLAPGGGLNTQIYTMNSKGMDIKRITKGGKVNNFFGPWSSDGSLLAFGSNEQNATGVDFYIYNVAKDSYELAIKSRGTGGITSFSNDKKKVLFSRLLSRGSNDLYSYDLDKKQEKLLTKHEGPGTFFGTITKRGEIVVGSNIDRDLLAFGMVKNNKIEILQEKNYELSAMILNKAGTQALLLWSEGGRSKMTVYDLASKKETGEIKLPFEIFAGGNFSPDDKSIVVAGGGSKQPTNIWVYNFSDKKFKKLTDAPQPGVNLDELIAPELVTFKSFDGLKLSGWLYKPVQGKAPYPTVISYHGGPEGQSIPSFNITAQVVLKKGIAFFLPNVRGSSGFGKKFVNLDNGELRFNGVKDIKACTDFLVQSGIAKKDAIGITGGSYGGYMVMAAVTEYPDMFAAGANLFGMINFETFFKHTEPWMAAISTVEYGDPLTQSDLLKRLSPIHKSALIKTPLLVQHGANDTNVPVIEAEQVVEVMKKNNVPVHYTLFPDEGHGWRKTKNRITSIVEIVEWFSKYLKT